ncbi:YciI family protein [Arenibaculum pallidiluteum]|uniref:YciI family protein n=1 Tax=Arenibaculum pallidiluteum TaxID=2812559 RepID=UPI001A973208|nr:YciI family protein [Arenibaculum pallidiluteum]
MQFLIIARDGQDEGAPARRMAAREAHLANVRPMFADGRLIEGGAILDEDGRMVGSAVIAELPDRVALDAWLAGDPYVTGGVWRDIQVMPFRCAPR